MKINFTQVLQDSWHFFRNQQKIALQFVLILFMVQMASVLLSPPLIPQDTLPNNTALPDVGNLESGMLLSFFITQLASAFISAWVLISVHQISQQNYRTLAQSFRATLPRFVGAIVLEVIAITPLLFALIEIATSVMSQTPTAPSIVSFLVFLFGMYFFVRLNLSATHYLTTQDSISQSLKKVWLQGMKRKGDLFIYTLLIYVVAPLLISPIISIPGNIFFAVVTSLLVATVNILKLVITYRFYSLLMKEV
ncbi:hypothetical protein [Rodentibacter myodis]|uniref:Beta-methylgalactoside transporter n=1 Tax=Rodentibacter myodis TaxID=1907939 RepID=A0A1V3JIE7_9PAST|nr:hypothetical protein [Rodentibacter myodis]OOF56072.1 hypothetical protein BKL49_10920 [Rodentibacter myodis]